MSRLSRWSFQLFPPSCYFCGLSCPPPAREAELCDWCRSALPHDDPVCAQCALPAIEATTACPDCRHRSPAFERTIAALRFEHPITQLVHAMKFSGNPRAAALLAHVLADAVLDGYAFRDRPELLVPVPVSRRRLLRRGFNQTELLAAPLARTLHLPVRARLVRRRHTRPQEGLSAEARQRNVRGVFTLRRDAAAALANQHVAILDDVMTTGSTVGELARTLRRGGARRVDVWVAARA